MAQVKTLVILGGTREARNLADVLVERYAPNLRVITSLAGRTASPQTPAGEIRTGGFGGSEGLSAYLKDIGADMLVDATHPYAARITAGGVAAATDAGIPHLLIDRPPWEETKQDRWVHVSDIKQAASEISRRSDACLITTGINGLEAFAGIVTTRLFVRLIEDPKGPLPLVGAEKVLGKPPYKADQERALMQMLGIDLLVTKNAGGDATRAKIDAARDLEIPVIMIDRPALPPCPTVSTIDEAQSVIASQLALD